VLPTLPIPMITALLLGYLLLRALFQRQTHANVLILIGACCVQSAIIALHLHYGWTGLRFVQPFTAALIPPLVWLAFISVTKRPLHIAWDFLHLGGPALVLATLLAEPALLDVLVPALFLSYGVALLAVLGIGEDSIPRSNLGAGRWPLLIWRALAVALILSALSDAAIGILTLSGYPAWTPWIVGAGSSITLLGLGVLGLSDAITTPAPILSDIDSELSQAEREAEEALIQRLEVYMAEKQPYLDPDLTLLRLARKLGTPAKTLSATINHRTGENVSRYVNRFRVEHACRLIREGAAVTQAMLASGFNTKSNFNREFLRVTGKNPTEWLALAGSAGEPMAVQEPS
jgi:AraC-like DNA-binding protein